MESAVEERRIGFIKTTYDISLDSQISLLRPADSLSILDVKLDVTKESGIVHRSSLTAH